MKIAMLTAAATLVAGAAFAQSGMSNSGMSSSGMSSSSMTSPMTASDYVMAAGQSDLFEIQEGQLASTMGSTAKVRAFGKQMVTDHTKSTNMVVAAAKASGMTPSAPALRPDQQQMIQQLQATTGPNFDSLYVQQQMQSHQQALQVQQGYAQNGDQPKLKAAAAHIVPVVQHHIKELQSMSSASAM